mmetsp:Transcript_3961/g.12452  ORF Transcript_3961/g.12452 Transcript_3961/m.12452 type:complete len:200 (+) Transcript_3961:1165-1764(+)
MARRDWLGIGRSTACEPRSAAAVARDGAAWLWLPPPPSRCEAEIEADADAAAVAVDGTAADEGGGTDADADDAEGTSMPSEAAVARVDDAVAVASPRGPTTSFQPSRDSTGTLVDGAPGSDETDDVDESRDVRRSCLGVLDSLLDGDTRPSLADTGSLVGIPKIDQSSYTPYVWCQPVGDGGGYVVARVVEVSDAGRTN